MNRWTWLDPATDESWEMPRNPHQMTSPHPPRSSTIFAKAINKVGGEGIGIARVLQFKQQPYEWSFTGHIRSEAQHDALMEWARKPGRVHLTDHLERTWVIRVDSLDLTEQRDTKNNPWRFQYTVKAILYGQAS